MKLPPISKYPKVITYHGEAYQLKFITRFKDKDQVGECDDGKKIIRIKKGLSKEETFITVIHEICHMLEAEHPVKLKHEQVYALSEAFSQIIIENF